MVRMVVRVLHLPGLRLGGDTKAVVRIEVKTRRKSENPREERHRRTSAGAASHIEGRRGAGCRRGAARCGVDKRGRGCARACTARTRLTGDRHRVRYRDQETTCL